MYDRFTDKARKALQLAHRESQRSNRRVINNEHFLVGLSQEGTGVADHLLRKRGVDSDQIRVEVEKIVQSESEGATLESPDFFAQRNKVIAKSYDEALRLQHNYVGTEHILLALLREQEAVAARALACLGLDYEGTLQELLKLFSGRTPFA